MSTPKSADVEERPVSRPARPQPARNTWPTVALVVLVILAIFTTIVMLVTDSSVWLRAATSVALWAAVLGAWLIMYYQRRANQFTSRNRLLAEDYQRALQRELDKRDELEQKQRAEMEEASRRELEELRQELTALRISLAQLFGPDFDDQLAIGDMQGGYYFDDYPDYRYDDGFHYGDYGYGYPRETVAEAEVVHDAQVVSETRESADSTREPVGGTRESAATLHETEDAARESAPSTREPLVDTHEPERESATAVPPESSDYVPRRLATTPPRRPAHLTAESTDIPSTPVEKPQRAATTTVMPNTVRTSAEASQPTRTVQSDAEKPQATRAAHRKNDGWPDFSTSLHAPAEPDIDWSELTMNPFPRKRSATSSSSAIPTGTAPTTPADTAPAGGGRRATEEQGAHTSGLSLADILKRLEQN